MKRTKPFLDNLSEEDRRTYRRWTSGFFLSYLLAVTVALGITYLNRPSNDLIASNEKQVARIKTVSGSKEGVSSVRSLATP